MDPDLHGSAFIFLLDPDLRIRISQKLHTDYTSELGVRTVYPGAVFNDRAIRQCVGRKD